MFLAFGAMSPGRRIRVIVAGGLTMSANISGPVAAVIVDVVHPGVRATAAWILSLTQNLFGLAAGPMLGGLLSDAYGLPFALTVAPAFCLAAAVMFAFASVSSRAGPRAREARAGAGDTGASPQAA